VVKFYSCRCCSCGDQIEAGGKSPLGVFHGSELALVFGFDELLLTEVDDHVLNGVLCTTQRNTRTCIHTPTTHTHTHSRT
jgi:hypothetical protein